MRHYFLTKPAFTALSSFSRHGRLRIDKTTMGHRLLQHSTHGHTKQQLQLVSELDRLSHTGGLEQGEVVWGLYQRMSESIKDTDIDSDTLLYLLESIAGDRDTSRALNRISQILNHITDARQLTQTEIDTVRRLCADLETGTVPEVLHRQNNISSQLDGSDKHKPVCFQLPEMLDTVANATEEPTARTEAKFQVLLATSPIAVDADEIWRLYSILSRLKRLNVTSINRLINYCSNLGRIKGLQLLYKIEVDPATQNKYSVSALISAYAKLGYLDQARRCYHQALATTASQTFQPVDWSMCLALFRSSRQKEGQALFERIIEKGLLSPYMYSFLIREYTIMQNIDGAYSLFGDLRQRGIKPDHRALNAVATACMLDNNTVRGNNGLNDVVMCMRSWGYVPDVGFFVALLKGYHRSRQDDLFDGLLSRLQVHGMKTGSDLNKLIMENAARRKNVDLVLDMAKLVVAEFPDHISSVVQTLCNVGRADVVGQIVDIDKLSRNNITANIKLELQLYSNTGNQQQPLMDYVIQMANDGFTPTFRLARAIFQRIQLQDGDQQALEAYQVLVSDTVRAPKSIELLLSVLQVALQNKRNDMALEVYSELLERLKGSDFGSLYLHPPTMEVLMTVLIDRHGIGFAQREFDLLYSLPSNKHSLPYSPLIEYYANHSMVDQLEGIVALAIDSRAQLTASAINVYCRYLAGESASVPEFTTFLRYLYRTRTLHRAANDVFEAFFVRCASEHKVSDFEWITSALLKINVRDSVWKAVVDKLASIDTRHLLLLTSSAIEGSFTKGEQSYRQQFLPAPIHHNRRITESQRLRIAMRRQHIAQKLLAATAGVWSGQAVIANSILIIFQDHGIIPSKMVYNMSISAFIQAWYRYYDVPSKRETDQERDAGKQPPVTRRFLVNALYKHVQHALVEGEIPLTLASRAMLIISSFSSTGYNRCLDVLHGIDKSRLGPEVYASIATGCARQGVVAGIDSVLFSMKKHEVKMTPEVLNILMHCYVKLPPPSSKKASSLVSFPSFSKQQQQQQEESTGEAVISDSSSLQTSNGSSVEVNGPEEDEGLFLIQQHAAERVGVFYSRCLYRVLSLWNEFEHQGEYTVNRASYSVRLMAYINAKRDAEAESLIGKMLEQGYKHDSITALLWIRSRLQEQDASGALKIFGAIRNQKRCEELSIQDERYRSLDQVRLSSEHFAVIIQHFLNVGEPNRAIVLLRVMHKLGIKGDTWLYSEIFQRMSTEGDSNRAQLIQILRDMAKVRAPVDGPLLDVIKDYALHVQHQNEE